MQFASHGYGSRRALGIAWAMLLALTLAIAGCAGQGSAGTAPPVAEGKACERPTA